MHAEAYQYVERVVADHKVKKSARVLEIGSFNVNGSVRPLFDGCKEYVGIDPRPGPGVDVVSSAADYTPDAPFDTVVTTEALEHDAEPANIITAAWKALKPGGLFIVTAAGEDRTPHGCNGGDLPSDEAYTPITRKQLVTWLKRWSDVQIEENDVAKDIYATAIKPQGEHDDG